MSAATTDYDLAYTGTWVRHGLVLVPALPAVVDMVREVQPIADDAYSREDRRTAHRLYKAGHRDAWINCGQRAWLRHRDGA